MNELHHLEARERERERLIERFLPGCSHSIHNILESIIAIHLKQFYLGSITLDLQRKEGICGMLGGTRVSSECPEMQSKPVSSCSHSTSTITPLGFSADSVPGMPTNLAPKGTCTFVARGEKKLKNKSIHCFLN